MSTLGEQTIALAGVAQAARMVDQIARTGSHPQTFLERSIGSLFVFDLERAEDLYGGLAGVRLGLESLAALLANQRELEQRDTARYLFSILYLERQFAADAQMQDVVRSRLQHASFRADHFASHIGEVCHSLAGIYQDTLSTLPRRIKVTGSAQHLDNARNADLVRSLLLAGLRAAFLWRQLGGRRWRLLLTRRSMLLEAQQLSRGLGLA